MNKKNSIKEEKKSINKPNFPKYLQTQTLLRLGEMLKLLKEGNSQETRQKIQSHCQYLSKLGKKGKLYSWIELLEIASVVIVQPNNSYVETTKLIIKEIKKASEKIIAGKGNLITISQELQDILPDSFVRLSDLETIFEELDNINSEIEKNVNTIDDNLWEDSQTELREVTEGNYDDTDENYDYPLNDYDSLSDEINENFTDVEEVEDDWFDEDYFEDDDDETAAFVFKKDKGDSQEDEINLLFEEKEKEEEKWNLWNDLEEMDSSLQHDEEEKDLIIDIIDNIESDLPIEKSDLELFETTEDQLTEEKIDDFLDVSTLKFEDQDKDKNFIAKESPVTVKSGENGIVFYENFADLDEFITENNKLFTTETSIEALESLLKNVNLYYETFEELTQLIDSENEEKILLNEQELITLIEGKFETKENQIPQKSVLEEEKEKIVQEELSEIDQLLQEAETKRPKPKLTKVNNLIDLKKPAFEKTMKVSVKQLDNLNNLIGEIVIRRNRLEEDQEKLHQFLGNLLNHVHNISDVGARMQDLYERSLLEGALLASREKNKSTVKSQLEKSTSSSSYEENNDSSSSLGEFEMDRFSDFHLLSQEVIELIVRVRESTSDIQYVVDETEQLGRNLRQVTNQLQEEINKSRMVPFANTANRLPRAVRDIAYEYDKEIQLIVEGKEVLIDKMILEHLWDPIQQLVKNSITHGIEVPEVRRSQNKPSQGVITIRTFLQGPQTVITIKDDGAGIDPDKVKQKAIEKKLTTQAQAANIKIQDVYDFLFRPGFSTKDKADKHAGRGVGLDIVRSKLNEIRGTVSIDSEKGVGTTFSIRLPLTLSIGKALCCLNDNARIAFPMDGIEDTKEYSVDQIEKNAQGQECIRWRNMLLPFRPLSNLLHYNRQSNRSVIYSSNPNPDMISIIILRGSNSLLALEVDQVIGQEEIVIKQMNGPIPKPKGIAGATVRSDGIVMPIADVIELIEIANERKDPLERSGNIAEIPEEEIPIKHQPLVMIVDDSIMVREMLSISFTKAGYQVEQARDGQDAWQKLSSGLSCDLIVCDIEMPRMTGFELLSKIRENAKFANIPISMLTSRGAEKHQKKAAELGADAYLVKPYVEKELLDSAAKMLQGQVLLKGSKKESKTKYSKGEPFKKEPITKVRKKKTHPSVLIIDDSVVVREMLSMTFTKAGYKVEQARDGQDAWDKLIGGLSCNVILCDIEMPRMNGLELLARIQQDHNLSSIPVAMVTSRGAEKHRKIAAELGAKAYFTKPYLEEELLKATENLRQGKVLLPLNRE